MIRILLLLSLFTLSAAPAYAASPTVPDTNTQLHYTVWGGGFNMLDADLDIQLNDKKYTGLMTAKTIGMIGSMFPWWNRVESSGTVHGRALWPEKHVSTNSWKRKEKSTTLLFDKQGHFQERLLNPPQATPNPADTAPALTDGAVDVMSASIELLLRLAQGEQCNQDFILYDGKRRFELMFSEIEFEKFEKSDYSFYTGGARRCDMLLKNIAGKWDKNRYNWAAAEDGGMKLSVWLAKLTPGGAEVPVRARTYGEFGTVVINLHDAVYNGQPFGSPDNN